MSDDQPQSVSEHLSEISQSVSGHIKAAATSIDDAIQVGRKPGNSLDTLSKVVRQAPLAAIIIAFLIGRASKGRW